MDLAPGFSYFLNQIGKLFLSSGSDFSLTSLVSALCVAALFVILRLRRRKRPLRLKLIARALFPRRLFTSASVFADAGYLFFNLFVFGLLFGWAVLSYQFLTNGIIGALVTTFGAVKPTALPELVSRSIITVMLFLAYELGYWINHYLSHRVPIMWEFHRVHHTATVLTPLTLFRVHPVYMAIFLNILAVSTATVNGFANYMFGETAYQYALADRNIILVFFIHTYVHLQHTQLWISFSGLAGRLFMSPAHHQVHHSTNPAHFNRNLGSCLAIWDWMFGTLYVPSKEPEKLSFGVEPDNRNIHSISESYIAPVYRAFSHIKAMLVRPSAPMPTSLGDRKQA